jgi:maltose alpha-D-glucosyltransferase/alpha-amylase
MGDDLDLEERNSGRTPMQWSNKANVGLQPVPMKNYTGSFISEGEFSYRKVNVLDQQNHSDFFLIFWVSNKKQKAKFYYQQGKFRCDAI